MEDVCLLAQLLQEDWPEDGMLLRAFLQSDYAALLAEALKALDRTVLYMSHVHGVGHIERTMLHGAMGAWEEAFSPACTRLLLTMCAYHDVGRCSDYLDRAHGARSAQRLAQITGLSGEALLQAQVGLKVHSIGDGALDEALQAYAPADPAQARLLAQLLMDADGLDRVRIGDLDTAFLRRPGSAARAGFAQRLFDRYDARELASGLRDGLEGFTLAQIEETRALVNRLFDSGCSCQQAALGTLEALFEQTLPPLPPTEGAGCRLLLGAAQFSRALCQEPEEAQALEAALLDAFRQQYGTPLCPGQPIRRCRSLAVDSLLFAAAFYQAEKKIHYKWSGRS